MANFFFLGSDRFVLEGRRGSGNLAFNTRIDLDIDIHRASLTKEPYINERAASATS